jgi:hypothetical protein
MSTLGKERSLPSYCVCEPALLPDNGCNRQLKHVAELNKVQCTTSTMYMIVVFGKLNKHLFDKTRRDYVTKENFT